MKKFISSAAYLPSPGRSFIGVVDLCEPDECPTMREIVERCVRGLSPGVRLYDEYSDDEPLFQPGMDLFDLMDEQRRLQASLRERQPAKQVIPDEVSVSGSIPETKIEAAGVDSETK